MTRIARVSLCAALLSICVSACGADGSEDDEEPLTESTEAVSESLTALIPLEAFADSAPVTVPARAVITSRARYIALVGHAPPVPVDFSREWVLFYGAGTKPTGGYTATIERASVSSWPILLVTTKLVRPGRDCVVTLAQTNPQVFAKIARPTPRPYFVRWFHLDEVQACTPPDATTCGGTAGAACPGAGTCVDDLCRCDALGLCIAGHRWDSSPAVCGCVPE